MRRLLLPLLLAVVFTAGGIAGTDVVESQRGPVEPQCADGQREGYVNEFGVDADGNVPANAGHATEEEAVEAEASRELRSHDRGSSREVNGYVVSRDGRPAAVFVTIQLPNGRFVVEGAGLCTSDSAPR